MRLMKEFGFKMTIYAIAKAMERNPDFAKACIREGYEIAAHGLRWLEFWDYDVEQDKQYIKDTFSELERVTGERPVGFYFGRGTPQTHVLVPEVCQEQGWELKYSSEVRGLITQQLMWSLVLCLHMCPDAYKTTVVQR